MRKTVLLFFLLNLVFVFAQDSLAVKPPLDLKFREDQFYLGIAYNSLQNKPAGFSQTDFSAGVMAGFLRDMPITASRQLAVAVGGGFSYNRYNQNLLIAEGVAGNDFSLLENVGFRVNRFSTFAVDLPLEFRYRTATAASHTFFRLHLGVKLSYVFYSHARFEGGETITVNQIEAINRFTTGVYLTTGYNTWNFYAYYGFSPVFENASLNNQTGLDLKLLQLGLFFYIL